MIVCRSGEIPCHKVISHREAGQGGHPDPRGECTQGGGGVAGDQDEEVLQPVRHHRGRHVLTAGVVSRDGEILHPSPGSR